MTAHVHCPTCKAFLGDEDSIDAAVVTRDLHMLFEHDAFAVTR